MPPFLPLFQKKSFLPYVSSYPPFSFPLELYPLYIGHPKLHPPLYNPFSRNPLYTINPFAQTPTPYTTLQSPLSHDYPYTTTPSYNPHPIQPLWLYIILIKCQKIQVHFSFITILTEHFTSSKSTSPIFVHKHTLIEHFTSSKNTSPFFVHNYTLIKHFTSSKNISPFFVHNYTNRRFYFFNLSTFLPLIMIYPYTSNVFLSVTSSLLSVILIFILRINLFYLQSTDR